MELKATYINHMAAATGEVSLNFKLTGDDKRSKIFSLGELLTKLQSGNKPLKIGIDIWRDKRSKNSNDYAWELLGKLGEKLRTPAVELYRKYVYDLQIKRQAKVDLASANTIIKMWQERGLAWIAEKVDEENGLAIIDLYYGSSCYNSKQMSDLLYSIVEDCKLQGIETKTPDELAQLKGLEGANEKQKNKGLRDKPEG